MYKSHKFHRFASDVLKGAAHPVVAGNLLRQLQRWATAGRVPSKLPHEGHWSMVALVNPKMLKSLREQRKLSQQDLADKSKVGIATIKRIESADEDYQCRHLSAERLAKALAVELEDLSEDKFKRVIDIGDDVELHIGRETDIEDFYRQTDHLARLLEARNRILKR